MKRLFKITLIVLVACLVSVPFLGCSSDADSDALSESQVTTVQRGDLQIDITAVGNLALSQKEDLAFEMDGTVEEVLVDEADSVEEGQVLARLVVSDWEDHLEVLEDKVITAERNLTTKERAVTTAERKAIDAERAVATKELAVSQAQLDVDTAEYNLGEIADIKKVQDAIDEAKYVYKFATSMLTGELGGGTQPSDYSYWQTVASNAQTELAQAEADLRELLSGGATTSSEEVVLDIAKKQLLVEQSQLKVKTAEWNLEEAKIAVEDAQITVDDAKVAVEDAKKALDNAREDLAEARNTSPEITAPFTGFITRVNVAGGDEIKKGTVAVTLADPAKFEADILVSEMDIYQVKIGGNATVQVDAMSEITLPAEVTHISPTATIQQGVVNYKVKVEVQPLEELIQEQQQAMQEARQARQKAMQEISSGELPERMKQAIEEGRMTQEQAEEMMRRMQQGEGMQREGQQEAQQVQAPTVTLENFKLMEGLTVTVSIIVDERNGVLLVPNSAITTQGRQTFVQVLAADGTSEQRTIQIGISDYQFTEVTGGLSEGEQIVVPQGTTTITTATQERKSGGMFIPGMGKVGR